jgi:hypothetical protein
MALCTGNGSSYGIPIASLSERMSRHGQPYLAGSLGTARISVMRTGEVDADGAPLWTLVLQAGPPPPQARVRPREHVERDGEITRVLDPEYAVNREIAF